MPRHDSPTPATTGTAPAAPARRGRKPALAFEDALAHLDAFIAEHGHANPTRHTKVKAAFPLGVWVARQRTKHTQGRLGEAEYAQLRDRGVSFPADGGLSLFQQVGAVISEEVFADQLARVDAFLAEHGHISIPLSYVCKDGTALGAWTGTIRWRYRNGLMPQDRIDALNERGFDWAPTPGRKDYDKTFEDRLACLDAFIAEHGNAMPKKTYVCDHDGCDRRDLGQWVLRARKKYLGKIAGPLSPDQVDALNERGFVWVAPRGAAARR